MEPEEEEEVASAAATAMARTPLLAETPIHLGHSSHHHNDDAMEEPTEFARLLALNPVSSSTTITNQLLDPTKHRSYRLSSSVSSAARGGRGTGRGSSQDHHHHHLYDPPVSSNGDDSTTTFMQTTRPAVLTQSSSSPAAAANAVVAGRGLAPLCPRALVTIFAGSLATLQIGFVCQSYISTDWAETILQIRILPSSSSFLTTTATTIQSTNLNLASLLGTLDESRQPIVAVYVWITSLLIPCFCMVLSPSWIVADHQKRNREEAIMGSPRPANALFRDVMEMTVRWAFTVVYMVMGLAVASQYLKFQWTAGITTMVAIHHRIMPGFVSFLVGISAALATIVLLRLQKPMVSDSSFISSSTTTVLSANTDATTTFVEPYRMQPSLFPSNHNHRINNNNLQIHPPPPPPEEDEQSAVMRVLEEQLLLHTTSTAPVQPPPTTVTTTNAGTTQRTRFPSFFQLLLVFQLGLLSLLLWFPAMLIPFVNLRYSGIAAKFMTNQPNPNYSVALYQIPWLLGQDGLSAHSEPWALAVAGGLMFFVTILLPIVAIVLGILTWILPNRIHVDQRSPGRGRGCNCARIVCQRWLYAIHPATGSIVMAVALIVAIHIIQPWTDVTLNFHKSSEGEKETKSICEVLIQVVGESCLEIRPTALSGLYFLIAHASFLELFIFLTLRWS